MTKVLIGSRALNFWNPDLKIKENTDWDIISYEPIEGAEWHDANFLNNAEMCFFYATHQTVNFNGHELKVMSARGLAIIKRSHLWRNLSFQKHITHYHKYLRNLFGYYTAGDKEHLQKRTLLTHKEFPQGNPNLMQSKEDFFNDAVTKKYEHDYLHELVAFYEKPLYTKLLRESNLAWCEESKWNMLTHEDKVKCVAEETFVIAIERFMIPNGWNFPSFLAYSKALDKVCTTLCSGWFRDFAIDYYPEIMLQYNLKLFHQVRNNLKE